MRKQLHEIEQIENYLHQEMNESDSFLFEVKALLNADLRINIDYQRAAYSYIRWFGRKKRKEQLESIFTRLTNDKTFSDELRSIFK
jgi:hypothetical protein